MDKFDKKTFAQSELKVAIFCHVAACGLITTGGFLTILGGKITPVAKVGLGLILGGVMLSPVATTTAVIAYQISKPKK